jgi:hypothetical protein
MGGLGGLASGGGGGRPSRAAVALAAGGAAAATPPKALEAAAAAASPRETTIGAELRAQLGLECPAPSAYSPRQSVAATVAGARGRWSNLIESADDEVRAIMTPGASPGYGGFDSPKDDCGFGDLGLDEHERAVLELSLRRQAKIERKLNRMAREEKVQKSRSQRRSSQRQSNERALDLSNGTAGPEQFAAAAIVSPRSSRRARGVIKPKVSGHHVDDHESQWDDEVALASGLPAVRGASATQTNEVEGPHTQRLKASAPLTARGVNQSPRGENGSSRRRERRARRERQAAEVASDDDIDQRTFSPDHGMREMDKMEKLRMAMAQMDGEDQSAGGMADTENLATPAPAGANALGGEEAGAGGQASWEDPAQQAAGAAAAAVADAKAKAEAAVKEAARLVSQQPLFTEALSSIGPTCSSRFL